MKAKKCPPGKYWCFDDEKCKKIPTGYHIGARGYLYPDRSGDGNGNGSHNGNGNGNGNGGSNGNGGHGNGGGNGGGGVSENFKRLVKNGMTYAVMLYFRGRTYNIQLFISKLSKPTRLEVEKEVNKIYPGAVVRYFQPREFDPTNPTLMVPEEKQPGAKDLVQQSDYMKPALQQKKKKKTSCEEFTLKKVEEALSTKDAKKLNKAAVLSTSDDPKDWDSARARQVDVDFKDMMRQRSAKKRIKKESFEIDPKAHKTAQKKAKIRNLAKGNQNPNEKAAAEKKAGGPKLYGEDTVRVEGQFGYVEFIDIIKPEPMKGISERKLTKGEEKEKERVVKGMKKSFKGFRARYGDDAESVMYATATKLAKEELAPHIKCGVDAAKPIVKMNGVVTKKEKSKPPEKKDSKSIFSQLTNKDEID